MNYSRESHRLLVEFMPDAYAYCRVHTDAEGRSTDYSIEAVNPAFEVMTGLKAEMVTQKKVTEIWPEIRDLGFDWIGTFAGVAAKGSHVYFEQYFGPLQRWYAVTAFGCEPGFFAIVFRDISQSKQVEETLREEQERYLADREQAQEALRESEERYFQLITNLPVGIHRTTPGEKGRFLLANRGTLEIFGYQSEEELKDSYVCDHFLSPGERIVFSESLIAQGVINQEIQLKKKDGTVMWCYESARAVTDENGNVKYFDCIIQDISDRKRAEEALHYQYQYEKIKAEQENEKQYRQLVEMSPTAIFVFEDGIITISNRAAADMLGARSQGELTNKTITEFLHPDYQSAFDEMVNKALSEDKPYMELQLMRRDGRLLDVMVSASYMCSQEQKAVRITVWDISEHKRKEQELINTAKLESLAVLAGGIAHDFNNILTVLLGNLSLAKAFRSEPDKVLAKLNDIEDAAMQTKDLANQLLTFSKGGTPIKTKTSIAEILEKSVLLAKSGANVRCEFDLSHSLYPVEVDEGQMRQVFNNLTINAVQAMPQGGTIRVSAENVLLGSSQATKKGLPEGKYVKITFSDEGSGISQEHLTRIFDPFYTTKENGSGLGLTTAKSIIQKHDGMISVQAQPGSGTTVYFYLPAVISCDTSVNGKILLMDDEESICKVTTEMLALLGYEVDTAPEGSAAVALYERARTLGVPYDAVILDLTIPGGMGGKDAIAKLLEADPKVRAIVSSGYSNDPVLAGFREYGFMEKLAKPYQVADIDEALRRVLNPDKP